MIKKKVLVYVLCFTMLVPSITLAIEDESIVHRGELATIAVDEYCALTKLIIVPPIAERPIYNDIEGATHIGKCAEAFSCKLMIGVGEQKFMPDSVATKSQAIVVFYRLLQRIEELSNRQHSPITHSIDFDRMEAEKKEVIISDLEEVPEWAKEEVIYMVSRGLVSLDNGYLSPNDSVTMNEINEIITKIHSFTHKTDDGSVDTR